MPLSQKSSIAVSNLGTVKRPESPKAEQEMLKKLDDVQNFVQSFMKEIQDKKQNYNSNSAKNKPVKPKEGSIKVSKLMSEDKQDS